MGKWIFAQISSFAICQMLYTHMLEMVKSSAAVTTRETTHCVATTAAVAHLPSAMQALCRLPIAAASISSTKVHSSEHECSVQQTRQTRSVNALLITAASSITGVWHWTHLLPEVVPAGQYREVFPCRRVAQDKPQEEDARLLISDAQPVGRLGILCSQSGLQVPFPVTIHELAMCHLPVRSCCHS